MRNIIHTVVLGLLPIIALFMSGCSGHIQPMKSGKALVGYKTQVYDDLGSLPPPPQPIVVSVYKFRDQTGQYKDSETVLKYSTAVTQGGTSILIQALQEAGGGKWFTVLERESLTNLLNERKIIRQTRKQYAKMNDPRQIPPLPPLLYAPIILEGGIISYETNLLTGGFGAKYFGMGGSTEFRRDTVSIFLRAVSVKNGQVLKTVNTNKTILSAKMDFGVFRFISLTKLLEVELGVSTNEPPQIAVREAIELAVYSMILEGAMDNIWSFKDPERAKPLIEKYLEEKNEKIVLDIEKLNNPPPVDSPSMAQ